MINRIWTIFLLCGYAMQWQSTFICLLVFDPLKDEPNCVPCYSILNMEQTECPYIHLFFLLRRAYFRTKENTFRCIDALGMIFFTFQENLTEMQFHYKSMLPSKSKCYWKYLLLKLCVTLNKLLPILHEFWRQIS